MSLLRRSNARGGELPKELLVRLFGYALDDLPSTGCIATAKAIAKVSKCWRAVLYGTPSLWTKLNIEFVEECLVGPGDSEMVEETPVDCLGRCLMLSHPRPLTISVRVIILSDHDVLQELDGRLQKTMNMLLAHSYRWKSVRIIGPDDVLSQLRHLGYQRLRSLESFTLHLVNTPERSGPPSYVLMNPAERPPFETAAFPPGLHHLEVNFHLPNLTVEWSTLQSLVIGFSNAGACRQVLAQTRNLQHLAISHIGRSEDGVEPLVLSNLRSLTLSKCAADNIFDGLSVPALEEISLKEVDREDTSDTSDHVAHSSNAPALRERCNINPASMKTILARVSRILKSSKTPITAFSLSCGLTAHPVYSYKDFVVLFPLLPDVSRLSLKFNAATDGELLATLVDQCPPLFPSLKELSLFVETECIPSDDFLISSPLIEELVRTRQAAGLQRFSLRRTRMYHCDDSDYDLTTRVYPSSSLAQTLLSMSKEGFEVSWTDGYGADVMEMAKEYQMHVR
ncbi:hypothetical protein CYLTODRAFT_420147 [Cylindrobasidium torrendii FP15055 ss-10]|uniref:Uncharacterized protein n=1 Tax=Cylindrobasidium torrendii FP15055 ss-10 TaxID=1314674 RepID=A0A0D7BIY9_9AGAR|nr:hypothetical protein CYLTODRAFT_420147 [Cylindrobasidium torrendii FP15055 ss-10]